MANYYTMNQVIIGDTFLDNYRWLITDYCVACDVDGITIEYQEKDKDGVFVTKDSINMGEEVAQLLINTLLKFKS